MSALDVQIGGSHYKGFAIQPVEFIQKNRLGFLEGCVIKRLCRFNQPTGKGMQDLEKALHEVDLMEEFWLANPEPVEGLVERLPVLIPWFCDVNALEDNQRAAIAAVCMYNRNSFKSLAESILNQARLSIKQLKKTLIPGPELTVEQQKTLARKACWPEDKIRWNSGFWPGFVQVQTLPAKEGQIAQWDKFIGQAPDTTP